MVPTALFGTCRVPIWGGVPSTVDVSEPEPKLDGPNTMNLVEKRA